MTKAKKQRRPTKAEMAAQKVEAATSAQVDKILQGILRDNPHLKIARDAQGHGSYSKFSAEFLKGFRKRLSS